MVHVLFMHSAVLEYNLHMSFVRTQCTVNGGIYPAPQFHDSRVLHDCILILGWGCLSVEQTHRGAVVDAEFAFKASLWEFLASKLQNEGMH